MHSFSTLITVTALCLSVFGAPTELKTVDEVDGPKKQNSYIVTVKAGVSPGLVLKGIKGQKTMYDTVLNGFAATLDKDELNLLRADVNVELIQEDGIMSITATEVQKDAPWGLQRISQEGKITGSSVLTAPSPNSLKFTYQYDSSAGAGVDVYVVDTGINIAHVQFGGRAKWGATFGGYPDQDGNGHGTHCAGTVGAARFGVAKKANLIAVKVLSDGGTGSTSDIISGLDYVAKQAKSSGRPTVVSMSLGGPANRATDDAVASLTSRGIHVVVAAGNESQDASNASPARAPSAITVAASDINDKFASFSNFGRNVDIIAPGVSIASTYIGSNTATGVLSGTSQATPHVAGLAAYFISKNGNSSPAQLAAFLTTQSISNAISQVPQGTVNKFANNDFKKVAG